MIAEPPAAIPFSEAGHPESGGLHPADQTDAAAELALLRKEIAALRGAIEDIQAIQSPLVGIEQVAAYFGKSPDTIRRWVNERIISCYKIPNNKGHTLLFSMRQIEEDLEDYMLMRL